MGGRGSRSIKEGSEIDVNIDGLRSQRKSLTTGSIPELDELDYNPVSKRVTRLNEKEIIRKVAGGDLTKGSCVSVAFAYILQKAGYDCLDFRGGDSQTYFSYRYDTVAGFDGVISYEERNNNDLVSTDKLLSKAEKDGREYVLFTGSHGAVVKYDNLKGWQYLELQSGKSADNTWKHLDAYALRDRFGAVKLRKKTQTSKSLLVEVDSLGKSDKFIDLGGYFNTNQNRQKKGRVGYAK